jgi:hypothetical protein
MPLDMLDRLSLDPGDPHDRGASAGEGVGGCRYAATLRCPAPRADRPRLRVAAFGVYASPCGCVSAPKRKEPPPEGSFDQHLDGWERPRRRRIFQ